MDNDDDHYQGLYQVPIGNGEFDEEHIVLTAIYKSLEMVEFLFLADDGHPMWTVAHNGDGTTLLDTGSAANPEGLCASYALDVGPPDFSAPGGWRGNDIHVGCEPIDYPNDGYNLWRYFSPVDGGTADRYQHISADIEITEGRSTTFEGAH